MAERGNRSGDAHSTRDAAASASLARRPSVDVSQWSGSALAPDWPQHHTYQAL